MTGRARRQQQGSKKAFATVLILLALVGLAALAWVTARPKKGPVAIDTKVKPGKAEGYLLGSPSAPVEVMEFADFECPACGNFAVVTEPDVRKRLIDAGKMSIRFYDFPLSMHRNTWYASHAAACANEQGKFWPMHDRIFTGQTEWNTEATSNPDPVLKGYAKELGLDQSKFDACYDERRHQATIAGNQQEGERYRVTSTPSFVIGGKLFTGSLPFDELKKIVDSVTVAGTGRMRPADSAAAPAAAAPVAGADAGKTGVSVQLNGAPAPAKR